MLPELRELRLLHAELDKQRDRYGRKENSKNTRGLVLIGSSTILAGFQAGGLTGNWQLVPTAFALSAVVLGVLALRPSRGGEVGVKLLEGAIRNQSEYRSELILYRSKLEVHRADSVHLEKRSNLVTWGFWLVLAGLVIAAIQTVLVNVH